MGRTAFHRAPAPVSLWDGGNTATDLAAEQGSAALKKQIDTLFRKWEHDNGFVDGAAKILLPAGWGGQ